MSRVRSPRHLTPSKRRRVRLPRALPRPRRSRPPPRGDSRRLPTLGLTRRRPQTRAARRGTRPRGRPKKDYLSPANLLASGSLACGFLALILATEGDFGWAATAVATAGGLDAAGGVAARRLAADDGGFGANLDSLAGLVSFGAAPALALHLSVLQEIPIAGIAACLAFVACGSWRLARPPLGQGPGRSAGLPIVGAGVAVAMAAALGPPPGLVLAATFALTVLMVRDPPFPAASPRRRSSRAAQPLGQAGASRSLKPDVDSLGRSSRPTMRGGVPAASRHERLEP